MRHATRIGTLGIMVLAIAVGCGSTEEVTPVPTSTTAVPTSTTAMPTVTKFPVGREPSGLAYDGEHMWVVNAADNTVTHMRRDGGLFGSFGVGERPVAVTYGGGYVWVANRDSNTVTQLTLNGNVVRTSPVDAEPVALAFFNGSLWVASYAEGTVSRVSIGGEVSDGVAVGFHPMDFAVAEDQLWVTTEGSATLTTFDRDGRPLVPVEVFSGPSRVTSPGASGPNAAVFDGESLWVTFPSDDTITRLGRDGSFIASLTVAGEPLDIALNRGELWVTTGSGTVVRVSRDREVIAVIGVGQTSGAIVSDGESIWVALPAEGLVARIDP